MIDFYPDFRKAGKTRQCSFYQQVFQLLQRNHLYFRSRSRLSFRIELRSSYCIVQLHISIKPVSTLWKITVAKNPENSKQGTILQLNYYSLRTDLVLDALNRARQESLPKGAHNPRKHR